MLTPGDGIAVAAICASIVAGFILWFVKRPNGKYTSCNLEQIKECVGAREKLNDKSTELRIEFNEKITQVKLDINTIQGRLDKLFDLLQKLP